MRALLRLAVVATLSVPFAAAAFCGFYVSGAGAELFNDATQVNLLRQGTTTVLAMQNNYRGPPENFAMVVPVPVVLAKDNVKTLPKSAFARMDTITAPRLVEYALPGECPPPPPMAAMAGGGPPSMAAPTGLPKDLGVKVEAKFSVAEYDIVILSAKDATGLEIWLKEQKYKIPQNAAPLLKPYIQGNWKFFVAKVDVKKVQLVDGQAVLSPLRFHYDSERFELPVRLGLVNSGGTQDLIVTVVSKERYEVANRPNVLVPTNVELERRVRPMFGAYYAKLLEKVWAKEPLAAITEFSWKGALPPPQALVGGGIYGVTCDPCPPPEPVDDPLAKYLGVNVLPGIKTDEDIAKFAREATVTRLHLRYTKDTLADDVVFKAVGPVGGGTPQAKTPGPAKENRFQGRYITWRPFDPNLDCWGGGGGGAMMGGALGGPMGGPGGAFTPASSGLAALPGASGAKATKAELTEPFEGLLLTDIPELGLKATKKPAPPTSGNAGKLKPKP